MKKVIIFCILLNSFVSIAQEQIDPFYVNNSRETQLIDIYDSVFFDMTKAVIINGTFVDIPVSIKSDDIINALDFQLKYNHANLLYDSIYDFTGHIQMSEYYNPNDSTIRFTSNSFTNYANNVKLVTIRFNMLSLLMNKTDFNSIKVYLNGDLCSYLVIGNVIGIGVEENVNSNGIKLFPNPAADFITLNLPVSSTSVNVNIFDVTGKVVSTPVTENNNVNNTSYKLDISGLSSGIYFASINTNNTTKTLKFVVAK